MGRVERRKAMPIGNKIGGGILLKDWSPEQWEVAERKNEGCDMNKEYEYLTEAITYNCSGDECKINVCQDAEERTLRGHGVAGTSIADKERGKLTLRDISRMFHDRYRYDEEEKASMERGLGGEKGMSIEESPSGTTCGKLNIYKEARVCKECGVGLYEESAKGSMMCDCCFIDSEIHGLTNEYLKYVYVASRDSNEDMNKYFGFRKWVVETTNSMASSHMEHGWGDK